MAAPVAKPTQAPQPVVPLTAATDDDSPFAAFMVASPSSISSEPEPTLAPASPRSCWLARHASQQLPGKRFSQPVDLRFLRPAELQPQVRACPGQGRGAGAGAHALHTPHLLRWADHQAQACARH
jgi:hypothetical protein